MKTANNRLSNNSIIITKDSTSFVIDFQLDTSEMGIISVVNKTKYIDRPSIPK